MVRRLLLPLLALVAFSAAPVARAQEGGVLEGAASALREDPLFLHPAVESEVTAAERRELRDGIDEFGGPLFIAVLPPAAIEEGGGTDRGAIVQLASKTGRSGVFALVVPAEPPKAVAGSNLGAGDGRVAKSAEAALAAHGDEGAGPILLDFVDRVTALSSSPASVRDSRSIDTSEGGGGVGIGALILLGMVAVAGGAFLFARRERRRIRAGAFQEAKDNARDDLVALGDDIRKLDLDVERPGTPQPARDDYAIAVSAYARAEQAWKASRTPVDLEPVSMALEEGRWAMSSAIARLEGREPPLRRAPCFFDPRHGPSSRSVEWAPPYGAARAVPACEADACRVERGEDPDPRQVLVGGQRTPYWNAGPAYGPFAGGFFGGAAAGLLPSLLVGSMLGMSLVGTMGADDAFGADGSATGDDFGGGDFGGGGFSGSGGDFGGGSF